MRTRRLRSLTALGLVGATALALAGCGAVQDGADGGGSAVSEFTGCVVSDDGGFQDRSINQGAYEGLKAARDARGIGIDRADSQSETDFEPNLSSMVQRGCDLTVSVGPLLADATGEAAKANPGVHFAVVDDASVEAKNVKPLVFDTAQAAFLAGYLVAGVSKTGTVGTFGGRNIPAVTVFMDGFSAGVEHYNQENGEDVEVLGWDPEGQDGTFLSSPQDSAGARKAAAELLEDGADVVLPVAGQAGQGAVKAVAAANEGGDHAWLVWPDVDGWKVLDEGREHVLTSVLKDVSGAVEDTALHAAEGAFDSTAYVGTLENGGVGLAPYHQQQSAVGEDLDRQVRRLEQDIIDGKVTVPSDSAPSPRPSTSS